MSTLLLDAELVLTCADCGKDSSCDAFGTEGWGLRRVSAQRLVDVCADCRPRAKPVARPKGDRV
jgi:hypothetical protein